MSFTPLDVTGNPFFHENRLELRMRRETDEVNGAPLHCFTECNWAQRNLNGTRAIDWIGAHAPCRVPSADKRRSRWSSSWHTSGANMQVMCEPLRVVPTFVIRLNRQVHHQMATNSSLIKWFSTERVFRSKVSPARLNKQPSALLNFFVFIKLSDSIYKLISISALLDPTFTLSKIISTVKFRFKSIELGITG